MQRSQIYYFPNPESSNIPIIQHSILPITLSAKFCLFSVFFLFVIYNLTICPTIYWRDAPEFINTAYTFGIAHPAGSPAYSTISKIFTFFPLSNIALRVNYVSLVFAVLTGWIIFFVIIELIKICFKHVSNFQTSLSAMFAVLILGSASSYWWQATVSEVYSMNCFFLSAFFLSAIKWYQSKEPKYLMLASFIFGISTAVYGANLLFVPALLGFYFLTKRENSLIQLLILAIAFFLLGYSIYLYLPVRSFTNPTIDWGNTETFKQFVSHITDQKDSSKHFQGGSSLFLIYDNIVSFIQIMIKETTVLGFFLIITGGICHFKKNKKTFFLLVLIGFTNTVFFMTSLSQIAKNGSLFLASFLIFTFWIGLGIYALITETSGYIKSFKYKNIIVPLIISFIVFSFAKDYPYNNKSSYYLPRTLAREMYSNLAQNAIVFSTQYWFQFRYYKDVENFRPDVTILFFSDMIRPDWYNKVTPKRFPMIKLPSIESKSENQHTYMPALIAKNINDRPIYSEIKRDLTAYNYPYLIPENKFLMRVVGHKVDKIPNDVLDKYILQLKESMKRELDDDYFFLDQEMGVRGEYSLFLANFASYLMARKNYHLAIPFLKLASSIVDIDSMGIQDMLGLCYLELGEYNKAETIINNEYKKNKDHYVTNFNLALLYFKKGVLDKSKSYLNNAISLNQNFNKNYHLLGLIYAEEGNYDQAIKEITLAIEKTNSIPSKKRMKEALGRVKRLKAERDNSAINVKPSPISD